MESMAIAKWRDVFVLFDGLDDGKVRRRRARQCTAVERPADSAGIGNVGAI